MKRGGYNYPPLYHIHHFLDEPHTARVTLPERRQRVQAYTLRGEPFTIAFTRLMLGFQVLLERLWEWET